MIVEPLGDAAFIVRDLSAPAPLIADALMELGRAEILDAWPSYETLGVATKPRGMSADDLALLIGGLALPASRDAKKHVIPACYELGEDLSSVASTLSLSVDGVIALHSGTEYQCFAIGFCPGFPYLGWLPAQLQGVPRMQSPRIYTRTGSVGITGKQTAIYPLNRPGGWPIIAVTPLCLVNVEDNYFPIRAGDIVSFQRINEGEFVKLEGERL